MSEHKVYLSWERKTPDFKYETYDRTHTIKFEGGTTVQGSAAPAYLGNAKLPNPEEMLIAAVTSCMFLTFLAIAAKMGFVVESYEDEPVGLLDKNEKGKFYISEITLKPKIIFGDNKKPDAETFKKMQEKSHENCFISNSVLTKVKIEPR